MNKKMQEKINFDIGLVFQDVDEQFFNKTVKEELESNLKLYNYRINELDKRVNNALIMVGLNEDYLNLKLSNLSSGEKKKIALATVLILNPKILILDEPTIGLDRDSKKDLIKLLRLLKNRYKKTIIIVSNNLDFILELSDYLYVLDNKKIVMEGSKLEVLKEVDRLKKYGITVPNIISFEDLVLKKKGVKLGYRHEINDLIKDIGVTVYETVVGFLLGTLMGIIIAIILWWSDFLSRVAEPYLVVLNSLPKVALRPNYNNMGRGRNSSYYSNGNSNFSNCNYIGKFKRFFKNR